MPQERRKSKRVSLEETDTHQLPVVAVLNSWLRVLKPLFLIKLSTMSPNFEINLETRQKRIGHCSPSHHGTKSMEAIIRSSPRFSLEFGLTRSDTSLAWSASALELWTQAGSAPDDKKQ